MDLQGQDSPSSASTGRVAHHAASYGASARGEATVKGNVHVTMFTQIPSKLSLVLIFGEHLMH